MAYHFANEDLAAVKGIDELDSCAYTVLAALFSAVEDKLLSKQVESRRSTAQRKKKNLDTLWTQLQKEKEQDLFSKETLGAVLGQFGMAGGKLNQALPRVEGNVKFKHFWLTAVKGGQDVFPQACALLMAHLDLADMPGNQCTAVVRDRRTLYVTGNGLWTSGAELEKDEDGGLSPDTPWFSTATSCQTALTNLEGSIKDEYHLDDVVFVIPTEGDVGGKFHAEMQLLEYMLDHKILPERGYIGVSKPCCTFCQGNLNAAGIHFWNGHGLRGEDPNTRVQAPYTSYKNPVEIEAFKLAVKKVAFYGLHG
jgi:OTT_1508-like deaminase